MNAVEAFRSAMEHAGLGYAGPVIPDGKLCRFKAEGDHTRNSWYVLHAGPPSAGAFGCWKRGIKETWYDRDAKQLTPAEREEVRCRIEEAKQAHEHEKKLRRRKTRRMAEWILSKSKLADSAHPYLVQKAVEPHGDIHQYRGSLVLPLRDVDGILHSLQFVGPDGEKRFLTGGRVQGCMFIIADRGTGPLCLCEGYATAASIFEATGYTVVCAMNCANLLPVALAMRTKWPERNIVIAGDNDQWTDDNPGMTKAIKAAGVIRARLTIPQFKEIATRPTDFNDLAQMEGASAVKEQIEAAMSPGDVEWPVPKPLPEDLPPVPPFNFSCLPDTLRPWLEDIAERMQCPPDFPAVGAVVALGSLVGRKIGIRPKRYDDWLEIPNLWGCVVGRPGLMKSPALAQAFLPLFRLVAEALQKYEAEMRDHDVAVMLKSQRKKLAERKIEKCLKDGNEQAARAEAEAVSSVEDDEPVLRRYEFNDSTVAKLGELLAQNPNGLLLHRDELVGFLRGMDKEGNEEARAFYLEAWNGTGSFTFDRIGRGTVRVESNTVSLIGGIQPDLLTGYVREAVRGGVGADGLLQRLQIAVWPDVSKEWLNVDRWPDTEAKKEAFAVFKHLDDLTAVAAGADTSSGIPFLRFAPDAQERFNLWRAGLEKALRSGAEHPAFESHLSKYRKLVPALALLIHLTDRGSGHVTLSALEKALLWASYLEQHARRIYSAVLRPDTAAARELAKHLQRGELAERFTLREVYRRGWAGLGAKEDAEAATEILADAGWIRLVEDSRPTSGRPSSPTFEINPKIHQTPKLELPELTKAGSGSSGSGQEGVSTTFRTEGEKVRKTCKRQLQSGAGGGPTL